MNRNQHIDTDALLKDAKASDHGEAYKTLHKQPQWRIGVGVRRKPPNTPSFFLEILIQLSPPSTKTNLQNLEKCLRLLKQLQEKNYASTWQDNNTISNEKTITPQNLANEYTTTKALMEKIFT